MLTLPHTLVALAIVKLIPCPALSLPLALMSHFFLDFFIIHWNPHLYTEYKKNGRISSTSVMIIIIDAFLAIGCFLLVLFGSWPDIRTISVYAAAVFLATLPDTIEIPYYFLGAKSKFFSRYVEFEHKHQANGSVALGLFTQVVTVALSLLLFLS